MSALAAALGLPGDRPARIVALGAHPDDIEIGAGGTIIRLLDECPDAELTWVVLSGDAARVEEARSSASVLTGTRASLRFEALPGRDGYLPYEAPAATKSSLAALRVEAADLVIVHRRDDLHQDHRFAAELAWQLWRWSTILGYEIPKYDGDLGRANLYVTLTTEQAERKVVHLAEAFPSQRGRDWYDAETFRATLRLRAVECRADSGAAEAFVADKLVY